MNTTPSLVFIMPSTSLHGGNRIVFEFAERLEDRGYRVKVVSPEPAPDWHPVRIPYEQVPIYEPGAIAPADIAIGTYYPTMHPAMGSGSKHVFHLCQGYEGVHREFAPKMSEIDAAYNLPVPKILISPHLKPVLEDKYGCRCHVLGQGIDRQVFQTRPFVEQGGPLRVGVVGPFGVRPKGIHELLEGFRLARAEGIELEVFHASAEPLTEREASEGNTDHFFHHLPTSEMPSFYHRLDAYFHPSHDEEGFPLPPLEAMACGVPVALTTIRPFAILPDDCVLRFPPGKPSAVVSIVRRLLSKELRQRLRDAALVALEEFSFDRVIDRMEAAFSAEGAPTASREAVG